MTAKKLLNTVAILIFLLGMAWFLLPEAMLASWGAAANETAIYMSRRYSVLLLGNAVILWLARSSRQSETQRIVFAGSFVSTVLMALTSLSGILSNTINASGWIAFSVEAVLALAFGYFLLFKREQAQYPIKSL